MTVFYKMGVVGDLTTPAMKSIRHVHSVYSGVYKQDLLITCKRDGNHNPGSLHYNGNAYDFRYPTGPHNKEALIKAIKDLLGPNYDVVPESSHVHIEYDPK